MTPSESRRQRVGSAPRLGTRDTLDVVGLARQPIDTRGQQRAAELMDALGMGAGVVDAYTGLRTVQEVGERREEAAAIDRENARLAELERRARAAESLQAESDKVEEGLATQHAREWYASVAERIKLGEITGKEGDDLSAVAADLVTAETDGQSDIYAAAFRDTVMPSLISDLAGFQAGTVRQTAVDTMRTLANRLPQDDPASIVATARNISPTITDGEIFDHLIRNGAEFAGADVEAVQRIADAAPPQFAEEAESLVNAARAQRAKLDSLERSANRESVRGLINDGDLATAEERAHELRKAGKLTEEDAAILLNAVRAERERGVAGMDKRLKAQIIESWRAENIDRWADTLMAAETTGGRLALPREDVKLTAPDGTVLDTISPKEAFDLSLSAGMGSIAERFAGDEEQMVAQQSAFLSANAAKWQPWEDLMAQGAAFMPLAVRRIQEGGEAPEIPPVAAAGFTLYKRLADLSPGLLDAHLSNPQTKLFYEMAEVAEQTDARTRINGMESPSPDAALVRAVSAAASGAGGGIDTTRLDKAIDGNATIGNWRDGSAWIIPWTEGQIDNFQDIRGQVQAKAEFFVRSGSTSSYETAVKQAVKSVKRSHTRMNGYLVQTSSPLNKESLASVAGSLGRRYAEQFGDEEGVDAGDITLVPVRGRDGLWQLVRKDGGILSPLNQSFSFLESNYITDRQILDLAEGAAAEAAARSGPTARQAGAMRTGPYGFGRLLDEPER